MDKIKVGIVGYGNLGRSAEIAIRQNEDFELAGIFTRREPSGIEPLTEGIQVYSLSAAENMTDKIDVMLLCGGSRMDLPVQGPQYAELFNTVDGFDTHAKIPEYFDSVDKAAKKAGRVAVISAGWDPGMFSINRLYGNVILPHGKDYTF